MDAPNPAAAAKAPVHGVKSVAAFAKKKPVITFGVIAGIALMAYMIRKRQNAANATTDAAMPGLDTTAASGPVGSSTTDPSYGGGGSGYYPDPTQGAGGYLPGGTSPNVPLPPDSWGPPWWWTAPPVATGGGLPEGTPGSQNGPPAPTIDPAWLSPPVYPQPAPVNGGGSPHATASRPQTTTGGGVATPSWAGAGHKYPHHSERGWYRVVTNKKGTWHYYGPSDNPKLKVG